MDTSRVKKILEDGIQGKVSIENGRCVIEPSDLKISAQLLSEKAGLNCLEHLGVFEKKGSLVFLYFARSLDSADTAVLKTEKKLDGTKKLDMPSLCEIWPSVESFERELGDLFGIHFGYNDSRWILPEGFTGFPLRKSFGVH